MSTEPLSRQDTLAQLEENLDAWDAQLHEDVIAAIGVIHKQITNPAQ